MLAAEHRMRATKEFVAAGRARRVQVGRIVIMCGHQAEARAPRVGFAIGRAVGNSVVRHRVARQLRAILRARTDVLTPGSLIVVKGLPGVQHASFAELTQAVDAALTRLGMTTTPRVPA